MQALVLCNTHLSRSSTLSPAANVLHPLPIKIWGVYHPLNSQCFRQNLSWGCKTNPILQQYIVKLLYESFYCHDYSFLGTVKSSCISSVISCQSGGWKTWNLIRISSLIYVISETLQRVVKKLTPFLELRTLQNPSCNANFFFPQL